MLSSLPRLEYNVLEATKTALFCPPRAAAKFALAPSAIYS